MLCLYPVVRIVSHLCYQMNNQDKSTTLLSQACFSTRQSNAIVESRCKIFSKLALLSDKDLDTATNTLHKSYANASNATAKVRLNTTKPEKLNALRLHMYDQVHCNAPLEDAGFPALNNENIGAMLADLNESKQKVQPVVGLIAVVVPKLQASNLEKICRNTEV